MPRTTLYSIALALSATHAAGAGAQQPIPIRRIGAAEATSKDTVGFLYGVRELSDGRLIANDAGARRLMLFDARLATSKVIADSVSGSPSPYGKRPAGIIPYAGDTTLLVDVGARAFVVFDARGVVTGVMSPPRANDVGNMANPAFGAPRIDAKGRLLYRTMLPIAFKPPEAGKAFVPPVIPDSAPIVRADFDTRKADTLAWLRTPKIKVSTTSIEGGVMMRALINPLEFIDDWAMLPDGSIAILRGRDYHIDWVNADGSRSSSPKMPFDWRRLSDEDKAAVIDSTKKAIERQFANAGTAGGVGSGAGGDHGGGVVGAPAGHSMTILAVPGGDGGPAPRAGPMTTSSQSTAPEVVPASELPDYMPPVLRSGTMTVDPAGNLWILPSTSAQSGSGLLYDVIDRQGVLFQRVRLPSGRALVGFGASGHVYMSYRTAAGTLIERARIE